MSSRKRRHRSRSVEHGNQWADHYTRKAQKERYPARSVYKLQEMQKRHRLIRPGNNVLDLGCAPGAWLLYASEQVGSKGRVIGIDLKPVTIQLPRQAKAVVGDIRVLSADVKALIDESFQVVLSDLAPATTGNKIVDTARSLTLCELALNMAQSHLTAGGAFVCKLFQGDDAKLFVEKVKALFRRTALFKPQSSRKASREIYIIGRMFLGGDHVGT